MKTSKISIVISVLLIYTFGCTSDKSPFGYESGVILEYMDTTTRPGDNFYQYANGNWIKTTEIPSHSPDYWMGTVLYEKSQKNFQKIIDKSQTTSKEDSFEEFLIGALYQSYIDTTTRQTIGIKPLLFEYKKIDAIDNIDSLTAYFAYATKFFEQRGYRSTVISPIKYSVEEDFDNPQRYALYLHQSGLGLPDKEFYLTNDKETKGLLRAYAGHIANMFRLAGVHCESDCIVDILDLEKSIASYHSTKEETRDYEKQYNPFTINTLNTASVNLDWTLFFKVLGVSDVAQIIVRQPEFIKGIDKLVTSVPLNKWKNYLKWQVLHHYADYLTPCSRKHVTNTRRAGASVFAERYVQPKQFGSKANLLVPVI